MATKATAASNKSSSKAKAKAKTTKARLTSKTTSKKMSRAEEVGYDTVGQVAKGVGFLSILEALAVGVMGILMILYPDTVTKVVFYVIGIFLMVKGIYKVINFFAMHSKTDFYNNDLLYGVIALVFGVLIVVLYERLQEVLGIIIGVWIIYSALVRMNTSIKMHAAGLREWFYVFLFSAVMLALGIYAIVNFSILPATLGWVLLASAVVSMIDDTLFMRRLHDVLNS